eukprot:PhM_4_TR19123/c0_g1_i1/m.66928
MSSPHLQYKHRCHRHSRDGQNNSSARRCRVQTSAEWRLCESDFATLVATTSSTDSNDVFDFHDVEDDVVSHLSASMSTTMASMRTSVPTTRARPATAPSARSKGDNRQQHFQQPHGQDEELLLELRSLCVHWDEIKEYFDVGPGGGPLPPSTSLRSPYDDIHTYPNGAKKKVPTSVFLHEVREARNHDALEREMLTTAVLEDTVAAHIRDKARRRCTTEALAARYHARRAVGATCRRVRAGPPDVGGDLSSIVPSRASPMSAAGWTSSSVSPSPDPSNNHNRMYSSSPPFPDVVHPMKVMLPRPPRVHPRKPAASKAPPRFRMK